VRIREGDAKKKGSGPSFLLFELKITIANIIGKCKCAVCARIELPPTKLAGRKSALCRALLQARPKIGLLAASSGYH
jgi:hypothetical protein